MKNSGPIRWVVVVTLAIGVISLQAQLETNATPKPKSKWESTVNLSFLLTRGNGETLVAGGAATTQKKWDRNELKLGADGTYGEAKDNTTGETTVNANSIHGFSQYNRLSTERLSGYGRIEGLHDEITDIYYRVVLSPGASYYFVKQANTDLSVALGPGFIWQRQGEDVENFGTMRVEEIFNHKFNDRAKFWQKTEFLPKLRNTSYFIVNNEVGISDALTQNKKLALVVTLNHTYNSEPASKRLRNDILLKTGITYVF